MLSNLLTRAHIWATTKRANLAREEGQGTIEYMAVAGIIVVFIIGLVLLLPLQEFFTDMIDNITALGEDAPAT